MTELMNAALEAIFAGGREIIAVYNTDFDVETKSDDSPLTEADRRAHHAIKNIISQTGLPILSEEGAEIPFEERSSWSRFWLVDPLDGTKEFVKRNGEFTVNIALIENGTPIAGVIYVPVLKTLYAGVVGEGSYKLETEETITWNELKEKGTALPIREDREAYVVVGSRSHMSPETEAYMNEAAQKHGKVEVLSRGSSLKLCMVAEGKADAYPRFAPTMEWDTGAGHGICKAAGFSVNKYPENTELQYNKENLLNPWFLVI
jgi:3'(2'), 5'-bisphosphate nucleotidase